MLIIALIQQRFVCFLLDNQNFVVMKNIEGAVERNMGSESIEGHAHPPVGVIVNHRYLPDTKRESRHHLLIHLVS
jgi:hypothetical protein